VHGPIAPTDQLDSSCRTRHPDFFPFTASALQPGSRQVHLRRRIAPAGYNLEFVAIDGASLVVTHLDNSPATFSMSDELKSGAATV
jgi:hypothetical protein